MHNGHTRGVRPFRNPFRPNPPKVVGQNVNNFGRKPLAPPLRESDNEPTATVVQFGSRRRRQQKPRWVGSLDYKQRAAGMEVEERLDALCDTIDEALKG